MSIALASPPSSSSSSRVLASVPLVGIATNALCYGREALARLGGVTQDGAAKGPGGAKFDFGKINIPVGVTPQNLKNFTLYDMLGLGQDLGAAADIEVIKKAYHKAVLMYHPDKAQFKTKDGKEDRTVFLKIQEAFNVLSNEQKRRAYDSQLPFDESIPSDEQVDKGLAKGPHKFFKIFDPVFKRNARFAVQKPVPELGDMSTPLSEVYKFYDYWVKFESWRDFTGVGAEHNPEDAGSREEKRWMMKENERVAKKLKKKEMDRIIALVMLAEAKDPRIALEKEKKKNAKEAEKNAKEALAKRLADEAAAANAWNEKLEAEYLERKGATTKEAKEKLKKKQSAARNTLRKLFRASAAQGHGEGEYGFVTAANVEQLCANCELEDLAAMNDAMGGDAAAKDSTLFQAAGMDVVRAKLAWVEGIEARQQEDERIARDAKRREAEMKSAPSPRKTGPGGVAGAAVAVERVWADSDLSVLAESVARYPPGTANRWQTVALFVNDRLQPAELFTAVSWLCSLALQPFNISPVDPFRLAHQPFRPPSYYHLTTTCPALPFIALRAGGLPHYGLQADGRCCNDVDLNL